MNELFAKLCKIMLEKWLEKSAKNVEESVGI